MDKDVWELIRLRERISELEKSIHEYTVIDAELSSRRAGMALYTRQASGLVFYKAADPNKTHSEHKSKLRELKEQCSSLKKELSRRTAT